MVSFLVYILAVIKRDLRYLIALLDMVHFIFVLGMLRELTLRFSSLTSKQSSGLPSRRIGTHQKESLYQTSTRQEKKNIYTSYIFISSFLTLNCSHIHRAELNFHPGSLPYVLYKIMAPLHVATPNSYKRTSEIFHCISETFICVFSITNQAWVRLEAAEHEREVALRRELMR